MTTYFSKGQPILPKDKQEIVLQRLHLVQLVHLLHGIWNSKSLIVILFFYSLLKQFIMAKVSMAPLVSNSLGDYSVYKQRGVDKLITRFKGGPSAEQMLNSPNMARVREQQSEFRGVGKLSKYLTNACSGVKHLADHNFAGGFTKIGNLIQNMETVGKAGQCGVIFSKHGTILTGFNFNRENQFSSLVTVMPAISLSRKEFKASLSFPDLYPGINFRSPWKYPLCRFIFCLGIVPDLVYVPGKRGSKREGNYEPATPGMEYMPVITFTEWLSPDSKMDAFTLELALAKAQYVNDRASLVLSVGVEFGRNISGWVQEPVKHAGCSMVLGVG